MTSGSNESPPRPTGPDMILLALFQSRLRERSRYLSQVIDSQGRRIYGIDMPQPIGEEMPEAPHERIRVAEQALAAVKEAERRLHRGRYGLCDSCNEPIGWDELLRAPEQTVCPGCSQFGSLDESRPKN